MFFKILPRCTKPLSGSYGVRSDLQVGSSSLLYYFDSGFLFGSPKTYLTLLL